MTNALPSDGPIDVFHLDDTGHRVEVFRPGDLGVPVYSDHRVVLLEDRGGREANLEAARREVKR